MPNGGFYGTKEEWERIEAPLVRLDTRLELFAASSGMSLDKNYHNWPERSLEHNGRIKRLIQIYLADEKRMVFNLWLCASQDKGLKRFWKNEFIIKEQPIDEISENLELLLAKAKERLDSWKESDLKLVKRPTSNSAPSGN
jgi:hypothetical protein